MATSHESVEYWGSWVAFGMSTVGIWVGLFGFIAYDKAKDREHELKMKTSHLSPKNLSDEELWILGRKFDQERRSRAKKHGYEDGYADGRDSGDDYLQSSCGRRSATDQGSATATMLEGQVRCLE